jgi:hypothetical protein
MGSSLAPPAPVTAVLPLPVAPPPLLVVASPTAHHASGSGGFGQFPQGVSAPPPLGCSRILTFVSSECTTITTSSSGSATDSGGGGNAFESLAAGQVATGIGLEGGSGGSLAQLVLMPEPSTPAGATGSASILLLAGQF